MLAVLIAVPGIGQDLDLTFATNGYVQDQSNTGIGHAIAVQPDNKILVAVGRKVIYLNTNVPDEYLFHCARYLANGSADPSFGTNGIAATYVGEEAEPTEILVRSDGKILLAGDATYCGNIVCGYRNLNIVLFDANGVADANFGTGGKISAEAVLGPTFMGSSVGGIVLLDNDEFLVAGEARIADDMSGAPIRYHGYVARFHANGTIDQSFGNGGTVLVGTGLVSGAYDLLVDDQNNIYFLAAGAVSGNGVGVVFKLSPNGTLDTSYGTDGAAQLDYGSADKFVSMDLRSDGRLVLGGYASTSDDTCMVATLEANGTLSDLMPGGISTVNFPTAKGRILDIRCDANDRIVIGGYLKADTSAFPNPAQMGLMGRLNEDGTWDTTFSSDGTGWSIFNLAPYGNFAMTALYAVELLQNGQMLASGSRTFIPGNLTRHSLLLRINPGGGSYPAVAVEETPRPTSSMSCYPVPASGQLFIRPMDTPLRQANIGIMDMTGRVVCSERWTAAEQGIDISGLQNGQYVVRVVSSNGTFTRTISVQQ